MSPIEVLGWSFSIDKIGRLKLKLKRDRFFCPEKEGPMHQRSARGQPKRFSFPAEGQNTESGRTVLTRRREFQE